MNRVFFSIIVILFLQFSIAANAQEPVIHLDSIYSEVLKERRIIQVIYPENYDPSKKDSYDMLLVLEGIAPFVRLQWQFLQGEGFIPKNMIMVGLPNTVKDGADMRDRDFTPTVTWQGTGGAANFIAFLKKELLLYIKNKYPVKDNGHTIYGGSLSGLLVMTAFVTDPGLFTSYMAVDPSLWYDNFYINKLAAKKFDTLQHLHNSLWIAGRTGHAYHEMGVAMMDSILQVKAPEGLDWACQKYSNETHYSTQFKGCWDGLKFSYGGFYASTGGYIASRYVDISPMNGTVVPGVPFVLSCYNLQSEKYIHYTTDGTTPGKASPTLHERNKISISTDSKLIARSFGVRDEYNKVTTAIFKTSDWFPSVQAPRNAKSGGLRYAYYEGSSDQLPDFKKAKPVRSGVAGKDFDLSAFPAQKDFAVSLEGYIEIRDDGYYLLSLGGDAGSKVYLDNHIVLGQYYRPGHGENYLVPLAKGFHKLEIQYLHKKNGQNLQPVYITPENKDSYPIPPDILYY
jgi:predicted alpha/beta superfamily hydrolase